MIAYVLRELGHDPSWIIGGVVPQLGGNAGAGEGWLVVEGDESDRSIALLAPEIAVVTNVELDHHATYALRGRARGVLRRVAGAGAARSCAAGSSSPSTSRSRCRASTTARMPPPRSPRSSSRASSATTPNARSSRFAGVGRRFELVGERGGVRVIDDYGAQPDGDRRGARARRARSSLARSSPSTSRTSTSERASSTTSSATALGLADAAVVTDVHRRP